MNQNAQISGNKLISVNKDAKDVFKISDGIEEICDDAFRDCIYITTIVIPQSVKIIGKNAFWGCTYLSSIEIPSSVTTIKDNAFAFCSSIKTLVLNEGIVNIGNYAFVYCYNLKSVTIPSTVRKISKTAFSGCKNITSIYVHKINKQVCLDSLPRQLKCKSKFNIKQIEVSGIATKKNTKIKSTNTLASYTFDSADCYYVYFKRNDISIDKAIDKLIIDNTFCSIYTLIQILGNKSITECLGWREPNSDDLNNCEQKYKGKKLIFNDVLPHIKNSIIYKTVNIPGISFTKIKNLTFKMFTKAYWKNRLEEKRKHHTVKDKVYRPFGFYNLKDDKNPSVDFVYGLSDW